MRPPLRLRPGLDKTDPRVRLLYSIGAGDVDYERGRRVVDINVFLDYNLGDERPTYSWSATEKAWVLVDIVRARA